MLRHVGIMPLLVCALSCPHGWAVEVVLLAHPKCALDKDTDLRKVDFAVFGTKSARLVSGDKLKDARAGGESYIIELAATKVTPQNLQGRFTLADDPKSNVDVKYLQVRLLQTYRVWYVKDADAAPLQLGDGFTHLLCSQMLDVGNRRFRVTKETPPELARRGMEEFPKILTRQVENAMAGKIILGPADRLSAALVPKLYGTPNESMLFRREDRPLFKPTKVSYGKKGGATVEVAVHNRLPVPVTGILRREETSAEMLARSKLDEATRLRRAELEAKFDLQPGEKTSLKFEVLPALTVRGLPEQSTFELRRLRLVAK